MGMVWGVIINSFIRYERAPDDQCLFLSMKYAYLMLDWEGAFYKVCMHVDCSVTRCQSSDKLCQHLF